MKRFVILVFLFLFTVCFQVYAKTADQYKDELEGLWIKEGTDNVWMVNFVPQNNEMIMYSQNDGLEEIYIWSSFSISNQPSTVHIESTNDMVPIIKMSFSVKLLEDGQIFIYARETGIRNETVVWNGNYKRYEKNENNKIPFIPALSGLFTNNDISMDFDRLRFDVYELYGKIILEIRYFDSTGQVSDKKYFSLKWESKTDEKKKVIIETIELEKGAITSTGFHSSGENTFILTKSTPLEE